MILIDSYPYDLLVRGELSLDSEITEHAVESGSDVADNIRPLPAEFSVDAIVSDTPIGEIETHETRRVDDVSQAVFGDQVPLPSDEAYNRLMAIRDEKRRVTIEVPVATRSGKPGKRTFRNMAITHLSIPFDADSTGGLFFSATFHEMRIVTNKRTTIRLAVSAPNGAPNKGLSLDKVINGRDVLWRKGKPPGSSPATDPPGVITATEVVYSKGDGKIYHADQKTPLTTEELEAFTADLNRDSALMQRRALQKLDAEIDKTGRTIERALNVNDYNQAKADNPGKYIDPKLFGI